MINNSINHFYIRWRRFFSVVLITFTNLLILSTLTFADVDQNANKESQETLQETPYQIMQLQYDSQQGTSNNLPYGDDEDITSMGSYLNKIFWLSLSNSGKEFIKKGMAKGFQAQVAGPDFAIVDTIGNLARSWNDGQKQTLGADLLIADPLKKGEAIRNNTVAIFGITLLHESLTTIAVIGVYTSILGVDRALPIIKYFIIYYIGSIPRNLLKSGEEVVALEHSNYQSVIPVVQQILLFSSYKYIGGANPLISYATNEAIAAFATGFMALIMLNEDQKYKKYEIFNVSNFKPFEMGVENMYRSTYNGLYTMSYNLGEFFTALGSSMLGQEEATFSSEARKYSYWCQIPAIGIALSTRRTMPHHTDPGFNEEISKVLAAGYSLAIGAIIVTGVSLIFASQFVNDDAQEAISFLIWKIPAEILDRTNKEVSSAMEYGEKNRNIIALLKTAPIVVRIAAPLARLVLIRKNIIGSIGARRIDLATSYFVALCSTLLVIMNQL